MRENAQSAETFQSCCRFGLAQADITPPVGIYHRMWGAAIHDRSTGVHRPLTASAVAFGSLEEEGPPSESEQILILLDHVLLWPAEMDLLSERASRLSGVGRNSLLTVFSHTHAAGLMGMERESLPGGELIPGYLKRLAATVGELVSAARSRLQTATITYGFGRCSLARNRDLWDRQLQRYVCGYNPDGPSDDTLLVARVTGERDEPIATFVNYACHPTTLAWRNTLISPDFPGATREVVERETGAPCLFLQGASGDLGPKEGFVGEPEVADRNGRQLGYAALSALCELPPPCRRFRYAGPRESGATLGTWSWTRFSRKELKRGRRWKMRRWAIDLPYRGTSLTKDQIESELERCKTGEARARAAGDDARAGDFRALAEQQTRRLQRIEFLPPGEGMAVSIWLWSIGDAFWLAVEGEPYQLLQTSLRERFPGVPIMVASLANGARANYLPPAAAYGSGRYPDTIAVLAKGALETIIDQAGNQIEEWLDRSRGC